MFFAETLCPPLLFSILQSCSLHIFNNFHSNQLMNSNCADLFHVLSPKTLYLINNTDVGKSGFEPLRYSPINIKTQHVPCELHLILPSLNSMSTGAFTSMIVLRAIQKAHFDPNYIFMVLSDDDILQADKYRMPLRLGGYSMTSTYVLFDTDRISVFCISCGLQNNYISIARDANQLSIESLFIARPPDFNGKSMSSNLAEGITFFKSHLKISPNNMIAIPFPFRTWNVLSQRLNFSINPSNQDFSGIITYDTFSNLFTRVSTPYSPRFAVSSNAILTEEYHLTLFTITRLNLYTVLLPFDATSWSVLSLLILAIIVLLLVVYNRLNFNSTQVVIFWMLRNVFEQDDSTNTKQASGSKTVTKNVVILWSICSMFIGWSYKGCVSSEISVKFPISLPNSLQKVLNTTMPIITTISSDDSNAKTYDSYLHDKIYDLLDQQRELDFSLEYLQLLSSLSNRVQFVNFNKLVSNELSCNITQNIARLRNSSSVPDSWSIFSFKEHTNSLTALVDTCSNFTSIKIPSNSNKFPNRFAWMGFSNMVFKIFANKLSVLTQSGFYDYWEKDFTRKGQVEIWKGYIGNINDDSANILIKAKAILRKLIAGINRYQKLDKLNPITLTNVHIPLVVFVMLCCSCSLVFVIEIAKVYFLMSNIKWLKINFAYLVKVLRMFISAKLIGLLQQCGFKRKIGATIVTDF